MERREHALAALSRWQQTRDSLENHYAPLRAALDDALGMTRGDLRDMRTRVNAMIEARLQLRESVRERERRDLQTNLQLSRGSDHLAFGRERPGPGRSR